jgi:hypothetical protein
MKKNMNRRSFIATGTKAGISAGLMATLSNHCLMHTMPSNQPSMAQR